MGRKPHTGRAATWLLCSLFAPASTFYAPTARLPEALERASALRLRGGGRAFSFTRAAMLSVTPTSANVDTMKCLGDWYVQVAVPTPFDSTAHNGLEQYTWDDDKKQIKVKYTFNDGSFS